MIATAQAMSARGLSPGRSGNVSMRFGDGMLITPSGMAYDTLTPADIVRVAADGTVPPDGRKPSSEWQFHLSALAARPDRAAVVHTHARHCVVLACRHEPIPAFHYMVAVAGGDDIPCVPYAIFGSETLADHVATGLVDRDACLMANHGMIALGRDLDAALELAAEVEELAAQYFAVLQLGKPKLLTKAQMRDVIERFKAYGQSAQASGSTDASQASKARR
ncbi:MAG: class II aldolase/adducin family protein [Pseudomonadota bacterium]